MTLSRQLIALIVALFVIGLLGTLAISLNNTRHFLITQLESHAQDTATSLGLSLSPPMANNDLPTMNSMVDAIFDRGYYQEITIKRIDGSTLIERRNPLRIEGVPAWFVERIPLNTPEGEALVMSGWRQAATVHVRSHPGYAYAELWRNGIETLWWFSAAALGTLTLGLLMLRMVLRPLRAVEAQAEAICARDYRLQAKLPRTRELRRMVEAMNRMSGKVKLMFDEQAQASERLREHAYKDPVTGLGNRRYFDTQLQHLMATPEEFGQGALLLVQLSDFKGFNDRHGYQAGDALLRRAATLINDCCAPGKACSVTRLGGADFAVIAAQTSAGDAELLGQGICQALQQLHGSSQADAATPAHVGIALPRPAQSESELLAEADMALRAAQAGVTPWYRYDSATLEQQDVHGAADWQDILRKAIQTSGIVLYAQPVLAAGDAARVLHREVLMRLPTAGGTLLSAGLFIPMAERLGLARELDKLMLSRVISHLAAHDGQALPYSVNLTAGALGEQVFVDWLCGQLEQHAPIAGRLIFELPEYGVLADVAALRRFAERIAGYGARCSIDHFGRGFASFGYLSTIKAHSIKIDGSYVRAIDTDQDKRFFVQALIKTARSIDLEIIAESVERQAEWDALREMGVDGVQGYLPGAPVQLV
jgi:diguanylate cyclase (GGDEF)-like protein